jgi:hypothetical protein
VEKISNSDYIISVCTYKVTRLGKQIVVFGAACVDGFLGVIPKRPKPASIPGAFRVEGPMPTPSASPKGNDTLGRGSSW